MLGYTSRIALTLWTALILLGLSLLMWSRTPSTAPPGNSENFWPSSLKMASKAARAEYWFNQLRDPETNSIPSGIRSSELRLADQIASKTFEAGTQGVNDFAWFEIGPNDVGGRTRALAVDKEAPDRLLAGGVSGGLWESNNGGRTWRPIETDNENLSVTSIVQDPREGQRHIWYYASGEFAGNSASDVARTATYFGSGLYKSTDGGRSWAALPAAGAGNTVRLDSPFDFVTRVVVSPVTGTLFAASNVFGIYRSDDQGASFGPEILGRFFPDPALGGVNDHFWSDVVVNDQGTVLAVLSSAGFNPETTYEPGVYVSNDDGVSWANITPETFPEQHGRSIIAFAPSAQHLAYIFTTTNAFAGFREDVRLHRLHLDTGIAEDLTENLPAFSDAGDINTQSGYNMALAVKPDDERFVVLGATNVYRSRDGFTSNTSDRLDVWIGGYDAVDDDFGHYSNHHPDQHLFVFDPQNPDRLWNANDGGIYVTDNITLPDTVSWNSLNDGYNVTQFYTVALSGQAGDPRLGGGSQDNGTPFIRLDEGTTASTNISVGDGGHLHLGASFAYVGFQNGTTLRLHYNAEGTPTFSRFSFIQPESAFGQLFITPFVVDPNNENFMYYAGGSILWRNDRLGELPSGQTDSFGMDTGWSEMTGLPFIDPLIITAIAISNRQPDRLYFAASDTRAINPVQPRLFRVRDASNGLGERFNDISIADAPAGGYIADIAINPEDADELLVVMSNYRIEGLYYSATSGAGFKSVEGNLMGSNGAAGPSIRAAAILPMGDTTHYFVGTSVGLFRTTHLDGPRTIWTPEAADVIGHSVVTDISARSSDGVVAIGTHGRGLFLGSADPEFDPMLIPVAHRLGQNYPNPFASTSRIPYDLADGSLVTIAVYDLAGRRIQNLVMDQVKRAGRHEVVFDAGSLPSGTYFYRLLASPLVGSTNSKTISLTRKMMIIK